VPFTEIVPPDHRELVIDGMKSAEKLPVSPPSQEPLIE
jgi:hypothetical protein